MLAPHRDPENAAFQPGGQKAPGTRFPKTPLKIPLNDENANRVLGGKGVSKPAGNNENVGTIGGAKGPGKSNMVTPLEPRTARAPLGNKTTNAKARAAQPTTDVKGITVRQVGKTHVKPTTTKRVKQGPTKVETSKVEAHDDKNPLEDEDVEYAPPPAKTMPYESDVLPENLLTFEGLKKSNTLKGYYQYYYQDADDNGVTRTDRDLAKERRRAMQHGDEKIRKDIEEMDWSVRDVPETKLSLDRKKGAQLRTALVIANKKAPVPRVLARLPSTLSSRSAASALSMTSQQAVFTRSKEAQPLAPTSNHLTSFSKAKKAPMKSSLSRTSSAEHAPAVAASRSTIGYRKGRSALDFMHVPNDSIATSSGGQDGPGKARVLVRSASMASSGLEATITPARYAAAQASKDSDLKMPGFLSIFDVDKEDDGHDYLLAAPGFEDLDDDFELQINA